MNATQALAIPTLTYQPNGVVTIEPESAMGAPNLQPQILATPQDTLQNGDFTISPNNNSLKLGDGKNELTHWNFDLVGVNFPSSLSMAQLTLTLDVRNQLVTTDFVQLGEEAPITTEAIQNLPQGIQTPQINLSDFYSAEDILNVLDSNAGLLPFLYKDDAIVLQADLVLEVEPCVTLDL